MVAAMKRISPAVALVLGAVVWLGCGDVTATSNPSGGCTANEGCDLDDNDCTAGLCEDGACSQPPVADGAPCSLAPSGIGMCSSGTCVAPDSRSAEECAGGDDEDGDELVDCQDVADCACAPECIELFLDNCEHSNLLTNPGFEETPVGWDDGTSFPQEPDVWGGDLAEVVPGFPGMAPSPLEGDVMMQFQSTFDKPVPTDSASSERVQLIAASGEEFQGKRVCGVASFARVDGDAQTDTAFAVVTAWYIGAPDDFTGFDTNQPTTSITTECFGATEGFRCGNGSAEVNRGGQWVRASSTTVLPTAGETTVLVMVRAQENVYDDVAGEDGPELDGHFVDDVKLFVVPDNPSPACLDALGTR